MNGIAKAGGILVIIASAFGIISASILILFGWLFGSNSVETVAITLVIIGVIIMVLSIMMIIWSVSYMRDGSKKVLLGVFSIICAVLSMGGLNLFNTLYISSDIHLRWERSILNK